MAKRKLEELNLLDDFLFATMVNYPEIGEKFVRIILNTIFDRDFGKLTVVPQKVYYGTDTDQHGARLDVYLEETPSDEKEERATVFDVEPDKNDDSEAVGALPRRVRFYHAKIDGNSLNSGESYKNLKDVIVIMITPYDPFGQNHMIYTIRNMCEEIPSLPYDDGARTVFLYTRGTEGNPSEALQQLLRFMEHTTEENAANDSLKSLSQMVDVVKHDREVSLNYMKTVEWEEMLIKQGRKEEQANTERERLRADREAERADSAIKRANSEAERADSEAERADSAIKRANSEAKRADSEAKRADSATERADRAEHELELLKARLAAIESKN